jgi:hypothetical protein
MRIDPRLTGIGIFLIVFGLVLFGTRQGWIDPALAERSWTLWPVLLIAGGLSMLLAGRPGAWIGGLVAATCLGAIAGGLVGSGAGLPLVGCAGDKAGTPFEGSSGELPAQARVELTFRCGDLAVGTTDGTRWTIEGAADRGRAPEVEESEEGVKIEAPDSEGIFGMTGSREQWDVSLPTGPTIDLEVILNAGAGTLTLDRAHLDAVELVVNAGSIELDLRSVAAAGTLDAAVNAGSAVIRLPDRALAGDLVVNAGSLSICAPEDVGLRLVTGSNPISSNDFEEGGLVRVGEAWESPDFATAPVRIELETQANAGSLSLNPQRACAG